MMRCPSVWMEKGRIVRLQENWVWVLMSLFCLISVCSQGYMSSVAELSLT